MERENMISETVYEQLKKESKERRKEHPDWPSHKPTLYEPNGRVTVYESMPTEKITHTGYCKYCYQTHGNWWMMDQRDYDVDGGPIILCGECEHTSAKANTECDEPTIGGA